MYFAYACQIYFILFPSQIDSAETDLVISGTGLGDVVEDIRVEVGGVDCVVTGVKDDQVNCTLGPMSAGGFDIFVDVVGKGKFLISVTRRRLEHTKGHLAIGHCSLRQRGNVKLEILFLLLPLPLF